MPWVIEKNGKYMSGSHFKNKRTTYHWDKDFRKAMVFHELDSFAHSTGRLTHGKLIELGSQE